VQFVLVVYDQRCLLNYEIRDKEFLSEGTGISFGNLMGIGTKISSFERE